MSNYPGTFYTGSEFESRVAEDDAAIRAAFGPKTLPYVHQDYPKDVVAEVNGQPVTYTVNSKEEEDALHTSK